MMFGGQNMLRTAPGCFRTIVKRVGCPGSASQVLPSEKRTAKSRGAAPLKSSFRNAAPGCAGAMAERGVVLIGAVRGTGRERAGPVGRCYHPGQARSTFRERIDNLL